MVGVLTLPHIAFGDNNEQLVQRTKQMKDAYEQRRRNYLDNRLKTEFKIPDIDLLYRPDFKASVADRLNRPKKSKGATFSREFARKTSARTLLLLSEGRDIDLANQLFGEVCEFYLNCDVKHLVGKDSFYWASDFYLHIYHGFGAGGSIRPGSLYPVTEQAFLAMIWRYVAKSKLTPIELLQLSKEHDGYWHERSENHWCMEVVTMWGFCEILANHTQYKDRRLSSEKTPGEMADYLTDYLKTYIRGRASKGFFTEIASGGYNSRMLAMFSSIQDHAKDKRLRQMARDIQDLYWAFWAEEQIFGERGGGKVRQRSWGGIIPWKETITSIAAMYFGIEKKVRDTPAAMINTLYSSYYPSDIVLRVFIEREQAAPYAIAHRRVGKNVDNSPTRNNQMKYYDTKGHVLKYSWCEEDFILGTCMRPPLDEAAWPLGSTQSWHHGLLIKGENIAERVVPKVLLQDTFNEQYAVQSKGTLICRRLPSQRNGDAPMGVFISSGLTPYLQCEDNIVLINSPKVHVAIRFARGGFTDFDLSPIRAIREHGIYLKNDDPISPVIIEAAAPDMIGDFAAFREAVLRSDAKILDGRLEYKTIYGETLTMLTEPNGIPRVNGEEVDYHPEIVYRSPFINSIYDSGIINITVGEQSVQLDFNQ